MSNEDTWIAAVRAHDQKPLWQVVDGRCAACVNTSMPRHGLSDEQLREAYRMGLGNRQ